MDTLLSDNSRSSIPSNEMDDKTFLLAMERLLATVQKLSLAKNLETIINIVRKEARELTGADGATFVLRENEHCYYVDEDAIGPLWKGKRFPMSACISGWSMLNKKVAVISDIYADKRIPVDAYRPTFVKSLTMVPIRTNNPIGAIGNYWASTHQSSPREIALLQALADSTSIAMENVQLYASLEKRMNDAVDMQEKYKHLSEQLRESLNEKESLLREVYHRVKNNLQIISSLIRMQADNTPQESINTALIECVSRVKSMAIVHEMLYQGNNFAKIPVKEYIKNLVHYLQSIYNSENRNIRLIEDVDDIYLKIETAIPCGLIINEVISNCFKHAFPNDRAGNIKITLKNTAERAVITISDDGAGFPETLDIHHVKTLGIKLITGLSKQIHATFDIKNNDGTTFILEFMH